MPLKDILNPFGGNVEQQIVEEVLEASEFEAQTRLLEGIKNTFESTISTQIFEDNACPQQLFCSVKK